jgi:PAS domain S-box-containing protein
MKTTHKIVAALAGAALLVVLVVVGSFSAFRHIGEAAQARKHTSMVIHSADELLSELRDAETGQRGFLLTGDEAFLAPYLTVHDSIVPHLQQLRSLATIDAAKKQLDTLAPLIDGKLAELARLIELGRHHDMRAVVAAISAGKGKRFMDSIRVDMSKFTAIEEDALQRHETEFQSDMSSLYTIIVVASLFTLLFALSFAYLIYRETQQRLKNVVHRETRRLLDLQEEMNKQLQQANTTLQVSEEKFSVTLNSIGDAVIATDAEGRVTFLNPLAEQLTGWTQASAAGLPVEEIFHIINQKTRRPSVIPVKEALAHGTKQSLINHTILIALDGSECAIADTCAPIRNRNGDVVGAVLVFRDVTEENAAQLALRDSASLIQTILNTVVDGIITIHAANGIIETVNPAAERMFGCSAAELIGQKFSLLIPELDQEAHNNSLEYYRASEKERSVGLGRDVIGRRKDGSNFPLEMAVSEMDLGGRRFFTGILRDATSRKQAESERNRLDQVLREKNIELESSKSVAEKANLAKSEFLSSMSHELRSPLNAILGFAQLMDSEIPPPTLSQKESIDRILHAGWYLLELINEILDLAVVESGKLSLSHEPVSLTEVMSECHAIIEPQGIKRGVKLIFPEFHVPCFVLADRTRLKQVFINILSNAVKYNRKDGIVEVKCTESVTGRLRISVRDSGAGLSPEKLTQLFEPFNRLGQETSAEEGTGIGLVMSKRLVELMGGKIGVESGVGIGSVFWFELATAAAPQLKILNGESEASVRPKLSSGAPMRTLLYVEDNPANLELVEQIIARHPDLRLLTAVDGNSGIELARAVQPTVILMDINLPGISGVQALEILREDPATSHIPILAISANAMPRDIKKGLEAGFFHYLTKPIKIKEFMDAINTALEFAEKKAIETT